MNLQKLRTDSVDLLQYLLHSKAVSTKQIIPYYLLVKTGCSIKTIQNYTPPPNLPISILSCLTLQKLVHVITKN